MTAKRFKFNGATNCIEYDNKSILLDSYGEDIAELLNELHKENNKLKQEIKGFEGCSHNWDILYDEAKNKVEELSKENKELKSHLNRTEKELPSDKNGYTKIICPMCGSDLKYSCFIGYMNGEQYEEFDCTQCDFTGRIRKGNLWDNLE